MHPASLNAIEGGYYHSATWNLCCWIEYGHVSDCMLLDFLGSIVILNALRIEVGDSSFESDSNLIRNRLSLGFVQIRVGCSFRGYGFHAHSEAVCMRWNLSVQCWNLSESYGCLRRLGFVSVCTFVHWLDSS